MRSIGIAGLQLPLAAGDNLDRICAEVALVKARLPWVEMVVVGELAMFGAAPARAQPLPGPAEQRMCEAARKAGVWLIPGTLYEQSGAAIYNTCPVIDPQGKVVARYRKIYPFYPYEEGIASGDEFVVFDVPGTGRFGVSICYDMWFPETTRTLAWMGAEVILHPTMTNTIDRDAERAIARASATTNQLFFVDVNVAGPLGLGLSGVYGPGGEIIHQSGSGYDAFAVDLDLDQVTRARERGWHGLGQMLKSFRDKTIAFPPYRDGPASSPMLSKLGPLITPLPERKG